MLKNDALKKENELLSALENTFNQMGYEVERTDANTNGFGDLLSFDFEAGINNEPVLASHYFLPIHEDEVSENYFVQSLTVIDEIESDDKKMEMLQAISVLNFNIAYGSFLFDTDLNILSYRYTVPLHESMSSDDAFKLMTTQAMMGFGIVSLYIAAINALLEDRITWEEYMVTLAELLKEGNKE